MKKSNKVMAFVMSFLMLVSIMPTTWAVTTAKAAIKTTTIDVSKGLTAGTVYGDSAVATFTVGEDQVWKDAAATVEGTDYTGYIAGTNNAKIWDDTTQTYISAKGSQIPTQGSYYTITAVIDSSITFVTKAATKTCDFVEESGTEALVTSASVPAGSTTYKMTAGHTYCYHLEGSKVNVYGISISSGKADLDWSTVAAPVLGTPTVGTGADAGTVTVPYTAVIGDDGGEKLTITMYDKDGTAVDSQVSKVTGTSGSMSFTPSASGDYTFQAVLSRTDKEDKTSATASLTGFVLPLAAPSVAKVTSKGSGKAEVTFSTVAEATSYEIKAVNKDGSDSASLTATASPAVISVSKPGDTYEFTVTAKRGTDSTTSAVYEATVSSEWQATWLFSAFGQGVSSDSASCGYTENTNGSVTLWDLNSKGKLVPANTDGLSFYYTAIPTTENFTLSADITVDKWTYTNGQEGFGMMACDRVGTDGDSSIFWNNSYMDSVTKVEYNYKDGAVTDDTTASKITMKLGVGSQEKAGVTAADLTQPATTVPSGFTTKMTTLETSCAASGAGTYNLAGNATGTVAGTVSSPVTTFHMTIQKNNTGYFVSYTDEAGTTTTQKYYDTEALSQLDTDYVYAGFFASRTAQITTSNISLTTVDPANDAPKEEKPVTYVTPSYQVISENSSNTASYDLVYLANADGQVVIKDQNGKEVANEAVTANTKYTFPTTLTLGDNKFTVTMTPDADYVPGTDQKLSSYDAVTFDKTVTYNSFSGDYLYVAANGVSSNQGTKDSPVDIYTAVKYAAAGQKIVLEGGTYDLTSTVTIPRGSNGTADANITMMADPDASERPVLSFGGNCEGFVVAGDYWYLQGFDVTGSANGKDGMRVCGDYDTMDNLNLYKNGNTGLQMSRYLASDEFADWPHDNLVLNCTSHGNADAGYEDADGFAAKLTVGENNVFDGCISYNNADDGWDLFAKPETGSIGAVTIQNCVAFGNGYGEDGTNEGNGNGFKLGGSSISGKHVLKNCVSFDNKAKGIDSNSCPDIQVYNSTTYNNGGSNIALYTNDAANTDFTASGVLSYRTQGTATAETFKLKGTQDSAKVYQSNDYYWIPGTTVTSALADFDVLGATLADSQNSNGTVTNDWFVTTDTNMDYATHVYSAVPITRNSDCTINMNGVLVLTDTAIKAVGTNEDGSYGSGAALNTASGKTADPASPILTVSGKVTSGLVYGQSGTNTNGGTTNGGTTTDASTATDTSSTAAGTTTEETASTEVSDETAEEAANTGDRADGISYMLLLLAGAACMVVVMRKKEQEE